MAKLTADELRATLKDDVGYSDEQLAGLTKPQLEKLAEGYMRQADYDRQLNASKADLETKQNELQAASDRLTAEMAEWATVQAEGGKMTKKMQADLEAARLEVTKAQNAITRMATDAGLDPAKYLEGVTVPPEQKKNEPPAVDSRYLTVEQGNVLAQMSIDIPAELFRLSEDHRELFGKPLDTKALMTELRKRSSTKGNQKSLELADIWSDLHNVPEARATKQREAHDAEIAAAEQRGREAALSESTLPGQLQPQGRHSPVFQTERKSVLSRDQPNSRINAALGALRTGKHKTPTAGGRPAA